MFELEVTHQDERRTIPLSGTGPWQLGSAEACTVRIELPEILPIQAELSIYGGALLMRPLSGAQPLLLKTACAVLHEGATLHLGPVQIRLSAKAPCATPGELEGVAHVLSPASILAAPAVSALQSGEVASVSLLSDLTRLLGKATDQKSLGEGILDFVCEKMDARRAFLARVKDEASLELIAARGLPGGQDVTTLIPQSVLRKVLTDQTAVLIGDADSAAPDLSQSLVRKRIQAVACAPVIDPRGRLEAILYMDHQNRVTSFAPRQAELLIWLGQFFRLMARNLDMQRSLEARLVELKAAASGSGISLIAESPAMLKLLERARRAAGSPQSVLILGETGCGKECIARFVHQQSPRSKGPFVARNCGAIPESLFESEMFGHKKGAFTGAVSDRKGAFLEAAGGTLFLDEFAELDLSLQTKLLRVLQEKLVRAVGADRDLPVDVRVILATNRELQKMVRERTFREDLYYRVSTITLEVPPLRERREDILPLARHFVRLASDGSRELAPAAEQTLLGHHWPGNVRELRAVVEQAVIFAPNTEIGPDDLNLPSKGWIHVGPQSLAEVERRHILAVLNSVQGNRSEASKLLGVSRSTLQLKLKQYEGRCEGPE